MERSASYAQWWRRPAGPADVLALAMPLVLSTASWTLMHFVDRVFLSWHSTQAVAAAMPAGMLHFAMICMPLGIAGYINTFVAQYYGADRKQEVGRVVWHGVWLGLLCIPVFLLAIPLAPILFAWGGHSVDVQALEVDYFQATAIGAGGSVMGTALSSFYTGIGRTRVVLAVDAGVAFLNVLLDYVLIFGLFGFPEWGMFGAGIATTLAQWLKVAVFAVLMADSRDRVRFGLLTGLCWDGRFMMRLLKFGGPSGLQVFVEMSGFTLLTFQMGRLGDDALAATTIAFAVNSFAFVPMLGLGIAVSTLVGQHIGGNRPDLAERATWSSLWLGGIYTGVMAILYVVIPDVFLWAFAAGESADVEELKQLCRLLLRYVAAFCILDMVQIVFASAIKGAGDTRFVLVATLLISPIPVALGAFGATRWNWPLPAFWLTITIWIWSLGVVYWTRFQFGPWRRMTVIEAEPSVEPNGSVFGGDKGPPSS